MIKRLTWFASGVVAGIAAMRMARRKVRQTADAMKPVNIARGAADRARTRARDLADAVRGARTAMHDRETELRSQHGMDRAAAARLPVEPGRVVPLRPRERRERRAPGL
jgi:hypothetical protein